MTNYFRAPWSKWLWLTTVSSVNICLASGYIAWIALAETPPQMRLAVTLALMLPIPVAALFMVRGYTLTGRWLLVHRLLWKTRIPLTGDLDANWDPEALIGGVRTWGNGGFFGFTGWFSNEFLGRYRAYLTDPKLAVILRFGAQTVVVSPESPNGFIDLIRHGGKD